jgi:hypothetical protein
LKVIDVPGTLDDASLDPFLGAVSATAAAGERALLDARHLRFADPSGVVALMAAGELLRSRAGAPTPLRIPESTEVQGYLARTGFFRLGEEVFAIDHRPPRRGSGGSDVLLELTPIHSNRDVHEVVDRVQAGAGTILQKTLRYAPTAAIQFSVVLSEVCQNVVEHAEGPGWVAAQAYHWGKRLGRHVLVVAVGDLGRGFRGSLSSEHSARFGDRWSDATALEAAFLHGITRFPDPGRGQGIQQIRKQVRKWGGLVKVRSGTARIADVPEWDPAIPPLETGLPFFPGAQITVVLPARPAEGA